MSDKKVNIAVLVSGGGTNLGALINAQNNGVITNGVIKLVISNNREAYALKRAENVGIPTAVILKNSFASGREFEIAIEKKLLEYDIGLIVLAGFMSILGSELTSKYENRIINVHPALIPSFCGKGFFGLHVHEAVLKYGVKVTGATVHFVNAVPDGGEIIMQKAVYVEDGDTPEILQKRVMEQAEWVILPEATQLVCKKITEGEI